MTSPLPDVGAHDRGLASANLPQMLSSTSRAWSEFARVISHVDLDAPTSETGVKARQLIARMGQWPDGRQLPQILADARSGVQGTIDQKAIDARVEANHSQNHREVLINAVIAAQQSLDSAIASGELIELALRETASPLGNLPVATYLNAAAYQLAVAARALLPAGGLRSEELEHLGLSSLVDVTGALASRFDITGAMAVGRADRATATATSPQGWTSIDLHDPAAIAEIPGVAGDTGDVIDLAAGRSSPLAMWRSRRVQLRQVPQLLKFAPIAREVPGLPGGPMLAKTASALGTVTRSPVNWWRRTP